MLLTPYEYDIVIVSGFKSDTTGEENAATVLKFIQDRKLHYSYVVAGHDGNYVSVWFDTIKSKKHRNRFKKYIAIVIGLIKGNKHIDEFKRAMKKEKFI